MEFLTKKWEEEVLATAVVGAPQQQEHVQRQLQLLRKL
jgi:hypothetical protein